MDLCLGLLEGGGGSKGFGYRRAIDGARETQLGVVARIVGLGAMAGRLAASTNDCGNRAWSQVTKCADLAQDMGALSLEDRQGIGQGRVSSLSDVQHSET